FADGIQDEILTKLASVADLKVISRTSTAKYKSKPEDLKTVSQQLGVATVLEGSVQKAADKVRVNVQLIAARPDSHLWAKSYDRAATWYGQAIAHDPNFALAMARLVQNRIQRHWFMEQMSEGELAQFRSMAEQAVALAPNLAQVHVALGQFYYHGYRQYERAL